MRSAAEDVWRHDTAVLISSSYMPKGRVRRVAGGFQLDGRWSFSSGVDHADWVFLGAIVTPEGAKPGSPDFALSWCRARISKSSTPGT